MCGLRLTFLRNRGELAEGWYDPSTLKKAKERSTEDPPNTVEVDNARQSRRRNSPDYREGGADREEEEEVDDEDDDYGPSLPGLGKGKGRRAGPGIPNVQDLQVKREMEDGILSTTTRPLISTITPSPLFSYCQPTSLLLLSSTATNHPPPLQIRPSKPNNNT